MTLRPVDRSKFSKSTASRALREDLLLPEGFIYLLPLNLSIPTPGHTATVDRVVAVLEKKGVRFAETGVELSEAAAPLKNNFVQINPAQHRRFLEPTLFV